MSAKDEDLAKATVTCMGNRSESEAKDKARAAAVQHLNKHGLSFIRFGKVSAKSVRAGGQAWWIGEAEAYGE